MLYPTWLLRRPAAGSVPARGHAAPASVSLSRADAAWLIGRAVDGQARRLGLGAGVFDQINTGPIIDALIRDLTPRLSSLVSDLSQAAEPTIRTVVREELAPKVGLYAGIALLTAGVFSGIVGAYFASRSRPAA